MIDASRADRAWGHDDPGASDEAILKAHVNGDPDAFAELVRRHSDRLWAVALRTCRDREEAADALQDAMLSAFRKADTYRGEAQVSTWLHRIVVNACLDRLRGRKARRTSSLDEDGSRIHDADPRDSIAEHDSRLTVWAALAQLPPDQRAAIVLVDLEGWPVDEAADILRCPPGTVKSRCHRGRASLAELLTDRNRGTPTTVTSNVPRDHETPKGGSR